MMVVDSSAWVDFFNGRDRPHVTRLTDALRAEEDLVTIPIIVTEVLRGFPKDDDFERARALLQDLPSIQPSLGCHVRAAGLSRALRRKGITVRGTVDCVIAQACLDLDAELLSPDRDFERIAQHAPLRVWASVSG